MPHGSRRMNQNVLIDIHSNIVGVVVLPKMDFGRLLRLELAGVIVQDLLAISVFPIGDNVYN